MYYKEDKSGQMLQEGINEAGAMSSWIAAATSYSVSDTPMIPFYIYYSMFGFQRIGDLAWAAGDCRAAGSSSAAPAGRTTLNGEGLQHEDGHSHLISATIPNCISYDPTYAHEVAVIIQDGLRRMFTEQEDVFYYLTMMNENYEHPGLPEDRRDEVIEGSSAACTCCAPRLRPEERARGCSCWAAAPSCARSRRRRTCWRASTASPRTSGAAELHRGWAATPWPGPVEPAAPRRHGPHLLGHGKLSERPAGPVVAATDYMRAFAEQIRPSVPRTAATSSWVRTVSAARLPQGAASALRGRPPATWSSRRSPHWPPTAWSGERGHDAIARYDIDPDKLDPGSRLRVPPHAPTPSSEPHHTGRRGSPMSTATEVRVPDIGDFSDVPIIEVHVAPGDKVNAEDPLLTLESDKATLDVPAPSSGTVGEVLVKVGDEVSEGTPILMLSSGDGASTTPPSLVEQQEPAPGPAPVKAVSEAVGAPLAAPPAVAAPDDNRAPAGAHAGPSVRRMARELGIDLSQVCGVGSKGPDHQGRPAGLPQGPATPAPAAAPAAPQGSGIPEIPAQDFSKFGPSRRKPCPRIKKVSGPFLHRSWLNVPHVTHNDEADITELGRLPQAPRHRRPRREEPLPGHAARRSWSRPWSAR
jgi:biotin carboxyl carrier protein